jgi:RNA polymerase sigma-70 factor (ECF subfamily)
MKGVDIKMDYNSENQSINNYIVEKYADLVYKICMTKLYNYHKSSVADACQNVFLNFLNHANRSKNGKIFKDEEHEKAFFIRTAINCCTDIYRKEKYQSSKEEDFDIFEISENSSEIGFYDNYDDGSLYDILSLLPEKIRYTVYLFYIEEYKTDEIAKILKTTNAAVRMRLKRGRDILRNKLQKKTLNKEEIINV